jgi:hypothetical protein
MTLNELSISSTTASASPKVAQPRVTHRCPDLVLRYPFAPQGLLQELRFTRSGTVIEGPALAPLAKVTLEK